VFKIVSLYLLLLWAAIEKQDNGLGLPTPLVSKQESICCWVIGLAVSLKRAANDTQYALE
jgi:hypothetical protein